MGQLFAGCSLV